jgi:multicomponent Na+:H+ antiporter subunit E
VGTITFRLVFQKDSKAFLRMPASIPGAAGCQGQSPAKEVNSVHVLSLTASLMLFWMLISGDFGLLNLSLGLASALLVVAISHRMDVVDQEPQPYQLSARLPVYLAWLTRKVIRSNLDVTRAIWTPGKSISPAVVRLKLSQQTALGKVIYANSITLTPGTVTLAIEGDEILVHALTHADTAALETGEMDRNVRILESGCLSPPASRS